MMNHDDEAKMVGFYSPLSLLLFSPTLSSVEEREPDFPLFTFLFAQTIFSLLQKRHDLYI